MSLISLIRKEVHWSKRYVLVLLLLFVVVPLVFAGASIVFQDIVPRDVPVAVMPEDENVTEQDLSIVEAGILQWTDPTQIDDEEEAHRLLEREEIYAIVQVPPGYLEEDSNASFRLIIDGSIAPFENPSELLVDFIEAELNQTAGIAENVTVDREVVGDERGSEEYLYPTFMMGLLIFFAFVYVPATLRREAAVLDRIRVESSLEALIGVKLATVTVLMSIPLAIFHLVGIHYEYTVNTTAYSALGVLLLTFLLMATVSSIIMVLSRFSSTGQFVNVILLLGLLVFSALVFPLGFFTEIRTMIAQTLPTHYAMIIVRSIMLKNSELSLFADWVVGLVVLQVIAILALKASIVYYRRTT